MEAEGAHSGFVLVRGLHGCQQLAALHPRPPKPNVMVSGREADSWDQLLVFRHVGRMDARFQHVGDGDIAVEAASPRIFQSEQGHFSGQGLDVEQLIKLEGSRLVLPPMVVIPAYGGRVHISVQGGADIDRID